jgi:hypothetical protein
LKGINDPRRKRDRLIHFLEKERLLAESPGTEIRSIVMVFIEEGDVGSETTYFLKTKR